MAENKKSFVLYADLIHTVNKMPSDKAGDLFKHILSYVNDKNPSTDDLIIELTFEPIKQQLKRDLKRYEEKRKQWSEAGKRSAKLRNAKQKQRTLTNVESRSTDSTVNVNVNVNDITKLYEKFIDEVKKGEHTQAVEQMYMRLKLKHGALTTLLKDFQGQLVIDNVLHKNTLEFRKHFNNWLNVQLSKGTLNQYKK
jgi:hypothetical protein